MPERSLIQTPLPSCDRSRPQWCRPAAPHPGLPHPARRAAGRSGGCTPTPARPPHACAPLLLLLLLPATACCHARPPASATLARCRAGDAAWRALLPCCSPLRGRPARPPQPPVSSSWPPSRRTPPRRGRWGGLGGRGWGVGAWHDGVACMGGGRRVGPLNQLLVRTRRGASARACLCDTVCDSSIIDCR